MGSYSCDCNSGCELNSNGINCTGICAAHLWCIITISTDNDECSIDNGGCSQTCTNLHCTEGRFSCSCRDGYRLHSDNKTCVGKYCRSYLGICLKFPLIIINIH